MEADCLEILKTVPSSSASIDIASRAVSRTLLSRRIDRRLSRESALPLIITDSLQMGKSDWPGTPFGFHSGKIERTESTTLDGSS